MKKDLIIPTIESRENEPDFIARKGRATGSGIKDLMSKTTRSNNWAEKDVLMSFSDKSIAYMFSKCLEAKTGVLIETAESKEMRYGKKNEAAVRGLVEAKEGIKIKPGKFKEFIKGAGGATPDGYIKNYPFVVEIKCVVGSWNGLINRIYKPFDEKHIDFWQIQAEILSQPGAHYCLYIVAHPTANLDIPPSIYNSRVVEYSQAHAEAILFRTNVFKAIKADFLTRGVWDPKRIISQF